RPHRVAVGLYELNSERLVRRERVEIDVTGARTDVSQLLGRRVPDLVLVNEGDLTYAKIRLDERSLATLTERLGGIDDPLARSLCWAAAWDMLRDAELPARRYLPIVLGNLDVENEISVGQALLRQANSAVVSFSDPANRETQRRRLADTARDLVGGAEPGSERQLAFAQAFIAAAHGEQLAEVRGLLDGTVSIEGLTVDTDLRWHIVRSLAAAGAVDDDVIAAELERDP